MKRENDILLCDLDAFYASVEQADRPELKGMPVIVGGAKGSRGVATTCSYEARKYGVRSAMPIRRAVELCPDGVFLPVNMKRYQEVSRQVGEIFEHFTPDIETVSIDEAYLAVKKGHGFATGEMIRTAVKKELGLCISIGVSENKLLAKIACELAKPDHIKALWPEEVPQVLWPLPVRVIPGVGPVTEKKLNSYGIKKVKDLADFSEKGLIRILGQYGATLKQYALGIDEREIETNQEVKSISEETTFSEDIFDRHVMLATLQEQSAGVGYRLRSRNLFAQTISIKLRFADFKTITRDITLAAATDRDSEIYGAAKDLFSGHCGKPPWRLWECV
jgi:DNA polymerase IV